MPSILVIQHAEVETPGIICRLASKRNVHLEYVRTFAGQSVPGRLGDHAGLLIMGGPMGVYEQDDYPFLGDELLLIAAAVGAAAPVLGICLGSQLLAAALGATVKPGKQKEIGWHSVSLSGEARTDTLFHDLPPQFNCFHWHGDVFSLPPGATPLASSRLSTHQAFRYGKNAYGLLFHLEVTEALIRNMLTAFCDELEREGLEGRGIVDESLRNLPKIQPLAQVVLDRWLEIVARPKPANSAEQ